MNYFSKSSSYVSEIFSSALSSCINGNEFKLSQERVRYRGIINEKRIMRYIYIHTKSSRLYHQSLKY